MYVCAVCKAYVHRIQNSTRVCCERRGCIDVDIRVPELRLDFMMEMVMKLVIEHRLQRLEATCGQGPECCEEKSIKVKVAALSEVGLCDPPTYDHNGQWVKNDDGDSLSLFVTCEECGYLDFESII